MTGGYDLALIISVIASVAGATSIVLLERTDKLLIPDWETEHLPEHDISPAPDPSRAPTSAGAD